jgi:hypothetical protein
MTGSSPIRRSCRGRASRSSSGPTRSSGTRVAGPPAGRRDPAPPPLVGADRGRRGHHHAGRLAAPLQTASSIEVRPRMDEPVAPAIVDELRTRFPDFVRAFEPTD